MFQVRFTPCLFLHLKAVNMMAIGNINERFLSNAINFLHSALWVFGLFRIYFAASVVVWHCMTAVVVDSQQISVSVLTKLFLENLTFWGTKWWLCDLGHLQGISLPFFLYIFSYDELWKFSLRVKSDAAGITATTTACHSLFPDENKKKCQCNSSE